MSFLSKLNAQFGSMLLIGVKAGVGALTITLLATTESSVVNCEFSSTPAGSMSKCVLNDLATRSGVNNYIQVARSSRRTGPEVVGQVLYQSRYQSSVKYNRQM